MSTPDAEVSGPHHDRTLVFGKDAEQVKAEAAAARAELTRQQIKLEAELAQQKNELEQARAKMEAEFRAKQAELDAALKPLRAELARMEEVGQTVDLYLGRDEHVEIVRDGAPSPADEPIVIRQRVLAMSEEAAILFAGENGYEGIDASDVGSFVAWLQDPEHLNRLLPEQKCVVVLVPTREASTSSNPWERTQRDQANAESYWFMRNGERVTLMRTDYIVVGDRLVPQRDEFVSYFTDRFGRQLEPGSAAWIEAEKSADARRRHFMKLMLTLQGIVDRTATWRPLPAAGVNLLDVASQDAGKVRIVNEIDLILTDGRESFKDWQKRLNAQLRVGHRVIGDWNSQGFGWVNEYERSGWYKHSRIHPPNAPRPTSNALHTIEDTRNGMLVIRYERTDTVEKRNVPVPDEPGWMYPVKSVKPTQRASCLIDSEDSWVLPFDLATVDDLTYYLNSREARTDFLTMVPVVRAAIAAKEAEAAEEAPFRDLIARQIEAAGCDTDAVAATVDRLVHAWKVKNKYGRALNGDADHEAKAARQIIAAYKAEVKLRSDDDRMIAAARKAAPTMICVGATKSGVWRAYAPSVLAHDEGVFLDVIELRKDGTVKNINRECIIAHRNRPTHVAWSAPEWDTWTFDANPRHYLTRGVRTQFIDQACAAAREQGWTPICVTETFDPAKDKPRWFTVYGWAPTETPADYPSNAGDLSWRSAYNDDAHPVWSITFHVTCPDPATAYQTLTRTSAPKKDAFGRYSASYRGHRDIPWWPDDAYHYPDVRPRLAWVDDDMFDALAQWSARGEKATEAARAAREAARAALRAQVEPYVTAIVTHTREQQIAAAHTRFIEDFGHGAQDVWEHHLSTLRLPEIAHPGDVEIVLASALVAGEEIVGRTLGDLADANEQRPRFSERRVVFTEEAAALIVPDVNTETEEDPS